jgi:MSHA biogenesis protein MshK
MRRALHLGGVALLCAASPWLDAAAQVPDPTQPPSSRALEDIPSAGPDAIALAPQRLTAIVVSPTRRVAVIDGVPVRVGDPVGTARVIEIEPLSVKLRGPEGEVVLSIAGPPLKGKKQP